jgi:hypothetical protein
MVTQMCAISTVDNPYDPFDNFDSWYRFDMDKGYNSCALLDRVSFTSDQFTDEENAAEIERAIDEIVKFDVTNKFIKIKKPYESV